MRFIIALLLSVTAFGQSYTPSWQKWNVAVDSVGLNFVITAPDGTQSTVALAAGLTQDIVLGAVPTDYYIVASRIKSNVKFSGAATVEAYLGVTGDDMFYLATGVNLLAPVTPTHFAPSTTTGDGVGNTTTLGTNLVLLITTTGSNINALTAGAVNIWILGSALPPE
jgi:drug/metabolite transporter (DMT)-like permease